MNVNLAAVAIMLTEILNIAKTAQQFEIASQDDPLDNDLQSSVLCNAKLPAAIMTDLDKALADITAIRSQLARGTQFRGYGPMTVAATGFVAMGAAALQALWLPDPAAALFEYVSVWVATAAISVIQSIVALVGLGMVLLLNLFPRLPS